MQYSISTVLVGLLATAAIVSAAPALQPRQVILGEYTTYTSTDCTEVIAHNIISPQSCKGLPSANSIDATFNDAQGNEFRLFFDSDCKEFARVLPLNTCVNTENYFSVSLNCIGGVECA